MPNRTSRAGAVILLLAILVALAVALMLFGARMGLWEPIVGLQLTRGWLAPMGWAVAGLGLAGLVVLALRHDRRGAALSGIALLIGLGLLAPTIMNTINPPARVPPINDITTDTDNPPAFLVLDETRPGATTPLAYPGAETAAQQKSAYPDIAPIMTGLSPLDAFDKALRTGEAMGWEIVATDREALRFEATARTPVYHFADDIVVVVTEKDGQARVDIRSVSRVGRSDRGVNAARIRKFTEAFAH